MLVIHSSYNMTSTISKVMARLFRFMHIKAWGSVGIVVRILTATLKVRSSPTQGIEPMEEGKDTGHK